MFLYIGFIGLLLFACGLIMANRDTTHKNAWCYTAGICGVVGVVLVLAWIFCIASAPDALAANQAQYEELIIYKQTVENSTNEYVRWNYYDKVSAWNDEYLANANKQESFWWGPYEPDLYEGTALIDFELHGDEVTEPAG